MKTEDISAFLKDTGLLEPVRRYQDTHNFTFNWYADEALVQVDTRRVEISAERIAQVVERLNVPQVDAFAALVSHELGHVEAFLRDLDWADEVLAWELAGEIMANKLPGTWDEIVSDQLNTPAYRWHLQRREVSARAFDFHRVTKGCPECRNVEQPLLASPLRDYDSMISDWALACPACTRQFRLRFKRDYMSKIWELDRQDYFPI